MSRSREHDERLDRLASEVRKGGGLALPSFFSAILDELLDNGPTDNDRIVKLVADVGVNKTKKLAETWRGDWEFLTSDLMEQLASNGYVTKADDGRWMIGENFVPGIRLETIPARKGLNAADGVVVWPKDERDALNRAAQVRMEYEKAIRQPRGKSHTQQVMNDLRNSYEKMGPLSPVLKDAHGRIIDGRHRLEIDPQWPSRTLTRVTTDQQAIEAIIELDRWHPHELLSKDARRKIEELRLDMGTVPTQNEIKRMRVEAELQRDASRSNRAIADLIGVEAKLVIDVRNKLCETHSIHRYEFSGGKGVKTGKHSTECWCGEGDTPAKRSNGHEPKPKPPPKWQNPDLLNAVREGGHTEDELISEFGVSSGTVQAARAHVVGEQVGAEKAAAVSPAPAPVVVSEPVCTCIHCPEHCPPS